MGTVDSLPIHYSRIAVFLLLLVVLGLGGCRSSSPTSTVTPLPAPFISYPNTLCLPQLTTVSPTATLTPVPAVSFPKIDRAPRGVTIEDWAPWAGQTLTATLKYNPASADPWQVDLRTLNLSQLDLANSLNDLLAASFDDRTLWPTADKIPASFVPQRILEVGKNPGLGVRSLLARGITGKGVGIAIIDMPLLVDHQEYVDRLRLYEEFFFGNGSQPIANMHGPAVASIAAGQTVGVAPQADLYYIAVDLATGQDAAGYYLYDFTKAAQAIRRILEINQQLPADQKIRVISMSFGWLDKYAGYKGDHRRGQRSQGAGRVCALVLILPWNKFTASKLMDWNAPLWLTPIYLCLIPARITATCMAPPDPCARQAACWFP